MTANGNAAGNELEPTTASVMTATENQETTTTSTKTGTTSGNNQNENVTKSMMLIEEDDDDLDDCESSTAMYAPSDYEHIYRGIIDDRIDGQKFPAVAQSNAQLDNELSSFVSDYIRDFIARQPQHFSE